MKSYEIVKAALDADPEITKEQRKAALATLKGRPKRGGVEKESMPALFTQVQAANFLGVHKSTIYRMVQAGELHPVQIHGSRRYSRAELAQIAGLK